MSYQKFLRKQLNLDVVDKQDADEESITLEQELISKLGSGLEILDE